MSVRCAAVLPRFRASLVRRLENRLASTDTAQRRCTAPPARAWSTSAAGTCRVHYGSQIDEHHAVRRDAGMFDVSHMRVVDVEGGTRATSCATRSPTTSTS